MRRFTTLLLFTLLLSMFTSTLTAQNRSRRMNIEDYEKRKMEFIKTQAGLTNSEAEKYFPLNSELTKKKFDLRILHRDKVQKIKDNSNLSDSEYRKLLEDDMEVKLQEAALDKEYAEKFEKVLSPEKLYRAQQAEREFMQREVSNFRSGQANRRR
ncbi:MAG TPA: hypothetical protein GXZ44_06260 [Fermentimonas caenicola]|jgi:nicotinamide riboside kinase|uniref:Secreted protein n=1 Tax=Fermentimonas caenicola TaxID=1562970 RepID=A0A098BYU0_9BACT|nr:MULTISPECIES: hypothetical protein [Lascolabacillus]MBP6175779.1 hypothetical protein [Fermentimonas sp.]MDI9626701.1 hypothetical protein [Bacteroidota bacterium]TAH61225.1 MAG: hypothetical protein EWM46_06550 [Fermentimonas caenicola]MBP6197026.1 hypothetical protein [Fermentimonas sp.]MBP7103970.1 hypothetical protein [Fermentimonas sp.]